MSNNQNFQSIETEIDLTSKTPAQPAAAQESEPEIEVVDDTPEQDRGKSRPDPLPEAPRGVIPEDDEIKQYSESVQKRMQRMKYEYHEQRRQKEAYERQVDEAAKIARKLYEDNLRLRHSLQAGEQTLIEQARGRVEAQLAGVRERLKRAHEEGNTEALVMAQEELAMLQSHRTVVDQYQPQYQNVPQPQAAPPREEQPRARAPEVDPKAREWASRNPWFQNDSVMTSTAFGIHQKLVESGIDPRIEPDTYYAELDKGMRKIFPEHEWGDKPSREQRKQASSVVAPATRTSPSVSSDGRKITLTASQLSIAKRLGLTPQQYAVEVVRQMREQQ